MENKENSDEKAEFIKKTIKLGNSSGVLLPKSLLGSEVKITLISKPLNIKKDTFDLLENYFPDLSGIYITSISKEAIEILAISGETKKIIQNGKYKISIVPLETIKKNMRINPRIKVLLNQSKSVLNSALLVSLRKEAKEMKPNK